jgi:DHA3 family tetracycline resistance protein-like MFS transporter
MRIMRPLAERDFALLWAGTTISLLGSGIYYVALAWQVYELSDSPSALSVVGFAWSVPMIVFVLGGGVFSDRLDRRRVLIAGDLIRAAGIGAMGILAVLDAIELWHIVVLVVLEGTGEALFGPAFGAIVPDLVPEEQLVQANSLNQFVEPLGWRLVGPAIGGWAIAEWGTGTAFLLDAGSFLVSAVAIALIRTRRVIERDGEDSFWREIGEGFRFVRARVWLWGTLVSAALGLLLFVGPYDVLVPYVVKNELGGGADDLGFVFAAGGVGAVLAALGLGQRGLPRRHITFMYGMWAVSIAAVMGYGLATELWHAMAASFVGGLTFTAGLIVWSTLMQRHVPTALLGRVSSFDWLVSVSLIPVSFAITGPIAELIGPKATLIGAGALGIPATLLFLFLPGMRDLERPQDGS